MDRAFLMRRQTRRNEKRATELNSIL
jgi:hypothetical protein